MRSLTLYTPFFVPHIGGMERALYRITTALSRRSWIVHIDTSELTPPDIKHQAITRSGASLVEWADGVQRRTLRLDPEHGPILFASLGPGTGLQQLAAASEFRKRGGHSIWRTPTADHASRNLVEHPGKAASAFDRIVANGNASAVMTRSAVPGVPVSVVPNLLLDEEVKGHDEDLASPRRADLAWAGRVEARKQPEQLAACLNRAARKGLVVVAQPVPSFGNLTMYDQFCDSLDDRVRLLQPTNGMHRDIAVASVFLHLSTREGSPNSLLEAASRGQWIIASDIPECRELLQDYPAVAWLTNFHDFDHHLVAHLAREDSVDMRIGMVQRIRERHNEETVVGMWGAVLAQPELADRA
ncbi:glycosyltransferase involved in cell wall biosynthesis [Nocardioides salarius]|uniref:Glycosyltransferase involved in cell wall biosynthesis n=1 Tax=Nocardioides salarius TaxID=374513 RepID=A0ABS2MGD2_9ACTN|nr:glycosyltransferase [Nocardioides salarius]MBM7510225.1 glycosyltransferase involved in cell wall biosynthesis [Nocardioides salarius]